MENTNVENTTTRPYNNRRANMTNLVKSYESFEEGYSNMVQLVPEICAYGGKEASYKEVISNILEIVKNNVLNKDRLLFAVSVSFREVGLKTDSNIAFGWRVYFDKETGTRSYKFRVSFINANEYNKVTINALKENDWTEEEAYRSRFWNNVESGNYRKGYNKKEDEPKTAMQESFEAAKEESETEENAD